MKIFLFIVAILMLLATAIGFFPSFASFVFANGSDGLMDLITSSLLIRFFLALVFLITVLLYKKRKRKIISYSMFIVIFVLWFLSGRMIAIFPDGRLSSGWFYLETNRVDICKNDTDCEKVFYYETKFEKVSYWRFKIINNEINTTIFVTPFISRKVENLFSEKFKSLPIK